MFVVYVPVVIVYVSVIGFMCVVDVWMVYFVHVGVMCGVCVVYMCGLCVFNCFLFLFSVGSFQLFP